MFQQAARLLGQIPVSLYCLQRRLQGIAVQFIKRFLMAAGFL